MTNTLLLFLDHDLKTISNMPHQIQTLACNFQLINKELHDPLQRQLMQLYDVQLFRVIDRVFQKFAKYEVEIEEIELKLPPIPFHRFSKTYVPSVEKVLTDYLVSYFEEWERKQKKSSSVNGKATNHQSATLVAVLISYLQKGFYTRSVQGSFGELWNKAMQKDATRLLQQVSQQATPTVCKRLVQQLSKSQLQVVLQHTNASKRLVTAISQALVRETQTASLDRKTVLSHLLQMHHKNPQLLDVSVLELLTTAEQKQFASSIQKDELVGSKKHSIRKLDNSLAIENSNPKAELSTASLVLYFLEFGALPSTYFHVNTQQLDDLFDELFASTRIASWRKAYRQYHHTGHTIHTTVLETYIAQKVSRIRHVIQLDLWYPLSKPSVQAIKRGMQKKQLQQSDFAKELASELIEEEIQHVVGYVEPEYKFSILYFVEAAVKVVEIQSLTDKITSFKKELYAFVLSYLLLKKGYSFQKKQFVANQLQQLARHFGMEYNVLLLVFLKTLNADVAFGREKELYDILLLLQSSVPINSPKEVTTTITKTEVLNIAEKPLAPRVWSQLFVYYLRYQRFPKWTPIRDFKQLVTQIPIFSFTKEKIIDFLNVQRDIQQFLQEQKRQKQQLVVAALAECILQKEITKAIQINYFETSAQNIPSKVFKKRSAHVSENLNLAHENELIKEIHSKYITTKETEMPPEIWVRILVTYLEVGQLPNWTSIPTIESFLSLIPVEKVYHQTLIPFFKSQKVLVDFMHSSIAKKQQLTFDELAYFVANGSLASFRSIKPIPPTYWTKIFVFYLSHGTFPYWSLMQTVTTLQKNIPVQKVTENQVLDFLASQPLIIEFLTSSEAKAQKLTLTDLVLFVTTSNQNLRGITQKKSQKKTKKDHEVSKSYWSKLFVYYLENGKFPLWSSIDSVAALIAQIPIKNKTKATILQFLKTQSEIRTFLDSDKAISNHITLYALAIFISNPASSGLLKKLKKQSPAIESIFRNETEKQTHWFAVFVYYLQHQQLPWWSFYSTTKQLLQEAKFDAETQRQLTNFLQKHKNSKRIWRTVSVLSEDTVFRTKLIAFFIPNASQQKAIIALASIFSPIQTRRKKSFLKHFGMVSNGAVFWESLWISRQLFFRNSKNVLESFWKKLAQAYAIRETVFASATLELVTNDKAAKVWQELMESAMQITVKESHNRSLSEQQIDILLFQTSVQISRQDQIKLRTSFHKASGVFMSILQKRLHHQKFSTTELMALHDRWTTLLFPSHKKEVNTIYKEWMQFVQLSTHYDIKDLKFLLLFLWESACRFTFSNIHAYIEQWLVAFSKQQRISFEVLFSKLYTEFHRQRNVFPKMYKSLVFVKLKQGISLAHEEAAVISREEATTQKILEESEALTQIQLFNAGVVLLWKFMPILFERTQLWNAVEKEFYDEQAKNKAVFLLQYLATGTTQFTDEHELLLLKILCGLPPEFCVEEIELKAAETALIESLLTAAIDQWKKLGTISIEGFRNTFLKRPGMLDEEDEKITITIEPVGIDVLLDFLPWTISTLRLPWLMKRIHVVWRDKSVF